MKSEDQQVDPLTAQLDSVSELHHSGPITRAGGQIIEILPEKSAVVAIGPVVLSFEMATLLANVESQPGDGSFDPQPNPLHDDVLTGAELDPVPLSLLVVEPNSASLHWVGKSVS